MQCTKSKHLTISTYRGAHKYTHTHPKETVATAFIEASSSEGKAEDQSLHSDLSASSEYVELAGWWDSDL